MDYRIEMSKEVRSIYPGLGIRPVGQKEGRNNQKDFKETLKKKGEEGPESVPVLQDVKEEAARELQKDSSETKGKRLNVIA